MEMKSILKDFFVAKFRMSGSCFVVTFHNGQKFQVFIEEI